VPKKPNPRQPSLLFEGEPAPPPAPTPIVTEIGERATAGAVLRQWSESRKRPPPRAAAPVSYLEGLKEQVIRDSRVLREDSAYHVPSRQFFIDRIEAYRAEIARLE
jgi:hypothetical protein